MLLSTPVTDAGRAYKMYATRLEKLGITTLKDFLFHIPHRYDDFSVVSKVQELQAGEVVTVKGTLIELKNQFTRSYKKIQKAVLQDETGIVDVLWFNQQFLTKTLHVGDTVALSGRVEGDGPILTLTAPVYEQIGADGVTIHTGRLVPIYPETNGVSSKWLRRQVYKLLLTAKEELEEYLPEDVRKRHHLYDLYTALWQIHFPDNLEMAMKAKERLAFDEVFLIQLAAKERRALWKEKQKGYLLELNKFEKDIDKLWESLPFELTGAQKRTVGEIFTDFSTGKPMNRLVEGDVGSGKTIVAAIAMYVAYLNGYQSVLMAPTEILAEQHFATIKKFLEKFGVGVFLATGSKKLKVPEDTKLDILIGTHAVLSEKIAFDNLGLVVIDEQQRFGVEQRSIIREKGTNPHLLTMTATPIPRTVALTLYGDLDLSIIDEMPKGRKEIKTWLVPPQKRDGAYKWIEEKITKEHDQVFIVCPFIEESENMTTVKAAKVEFERLQKNVFPKLKLAMLHGKMKAKEKDEVLADFKAKKYDILVATPVVEVGIDIPNATIILIEAADRFGLAGLHQLRGRVGRGDKQSFCLLFTESKNAQTTTRLKSLETMHNGAALAELDLQMRGAGELYGTLQHGRRWLKIASFGDFMLIERAKEEANNVFGKLPDLPLLKQKVEEVTIKQVNPD